MKSVFKYQVFLEFPTVLSIPIGAKFLFFDLQGVQLCAWFEVNPQNAAEKRTFRVFGTGHEIPRECAWLGTTTADKPYVWHLYEMLGF